MGRAQGTCWLVVGACLALLALLLALGAAPLDRFIEIEVQKAIRQNVVWQPDSPEGVKARYADNSDPSMPPLMTSFRFLNITNLADVRRGARPMLQEVGPYVFQAMKLKRDVQWVNNNTSVRWREYAYYIFDPRQSNGTLADPITTLNVPLAGAVEVIGSLGVWKARRLLQMLAAWVEGWGDPRIQGLFTTRTVGELLFGYEDQLLKQLARFVPGLDPSFRLQPNMTSEEEADRALPTQASTGLGDLSGAWQLQQWKNLSAVTSWNPPHLERVRGSDGLQFRPGLALGDRQELWLGEVYRAVPLVATEELEQGGVPLLRLRVDPATLDLDPRFYQYTRGLFNITSPTAGGPGGPPNKPGPPIFLSRPHFCGADPSLAAGVQGLKCNPKRHETYIDVEPNTGATLGASVRLMMSSWFGRRWSMIDGAVQDTTLPIFWAEVASKALPAQLRQLKPLLWARAAQRALRLHAHIAAAGLAAAAVLALAVGTVTVLRCGASDAELEAAAAGSAAEPEANGSAEAAAVREPLLPASFPVAAEEDGEGQPDGDVEQQQQKEQNEQQQPGQGIVAGVLGRLPLLGRWSSQGNGTGTADAAATEAADAQP